MPTEAELLAAIDASPDEDAPRLAHADWLEQNSQPQRAAFIRAQLAGRPADEKPWVAGLPRVPGMDWACHRGYPEKVRFRMAKAFRRGLPLAVGHGARRVELTGPAGVSDLASMPSLESVEGLELTSIAPEAVLGLLASRHLVKLRHLSVGPVGIGQEFIERLAELSVLARLQSLDLHLATYTPLPEGPVAALVNSPHITRLQELRLSCSLSEGAMRALWRASSLGGLVALELAWRLISFQMQSGFEGLGDGGALPSLEQFRFGHPLQEQDVALAVAGASKWSRLSVLILAGTKAGDAGACALAGAPHLARLERLDLSDNLIGAAGASALGRSVSLSSLRDLRLEKNPAPAQLREAVEARFRAGGPPFENAPPAPAVPASLPSAPLIGPADEDGLVRAIWADPHDPVARLVYADWLEERGAADHAALLRAEAAERPALFERISAGMRAGAFASCVPGLSEDGLPCVSITTSRLRAKAVEREWPAWLRRHHSSEIQLRGNPRDWAGFFAGEWLAHVRGLWFERFFAFKALAASSQVAGLASLTLGTNYNDLGLVADLFRQSRMRGLCRLSMRGSYLNAGGMQALADAPFAGHLRHLDIWGIRPEALEAVSILAGSASFGGLVTLTLPGVHVGDVEVKALVETTGLLCLRNLDLWGNSAGDPFGDLGWDALAQSSLLPRLNRLRLSATGISQKAVERLARAVAAAPRCRLVLAGSLEAEACASLAAILGERLVVE